MSVISTTVEKIGDGLMLFGTFVNREEGNVASA